MSNLIANQDDTFIKLENGFPRDIYLFENIPIFCVLNFIQFEKKDEYKYTLPLNMVVKNNEKEIYSFKVYFSMNTKAPDEESHDKYMEIKNFK